MARAMVTGPTSLSGYWGTPEYMYLASMPGTEPVTRTGGSLGLAGSWW